MKKSNLPNPLHILFIAAEADPFIKVGGLGDVAGSLPLAIKAARPDIDIRLAIPYYGSIKLKSPAKSLVNFPIPSKNGPVQAEVFETNLGEVPVYLIAGDPIHPYQPVYGSDFARDAEKFVFFSLACLYLPHYIDWPIDILHANDWHTAVALHELRFGSRSHDVSLSRVKSVLTIHNLPFMGSNSEPALAKFKIKPSQNPDMPEWSRSLPLPMGLNAADKIVAVSPTYAREILKPGYGCDLQDFLRTRQSGIKGILNGIDYSAWNPSADPFIKNKFSPVSLENRIVNKKAIQTEVSFPMDDSLPLLAFIGRMDVQKGVDLLIDTVKGISRNDWQLIILGTGSQTLEKSALDLQSLFPENVRFLNKFDSSLSHRIYSSADILLMPSRYEPCGLAQIIAMRYGCIPVATATGGLKDTVRDFSADPEHATGFLSKKIDVSFFTEKVGLALDVYKDKTTWQQLQRNAMSADFSWRKSALKYIHLYEELIKPEQ